MSDYTKWNISSTGIAFDPQTGESFQLNETAKMMIQLLRQELSSEKIAHEISKLFGITYEQAITDLIEFQSEIKIIQY